MSKLSLTSVVKLNTGSTIPVLGFGVFQSTDAYKSVTAALEAGYRHIDSVCSLDFGRSTQQLCANADLVLQQARFYRNEPQVAEAIRDSSLSRKDIFFTTKVLSSEHGTSATARAIDDSLARAKEEYFDLVLLHDPNSGPKKRLEAYKALLEANKQGKIKNVGVSNFGVRHLQELADAGLPAPSINQIELHPWLQQTSIVKYCNSNGIVVQAYCPLVRGDRMDDPTLIEITKQVNRTPAQVLIRWSLQRGFVPLPKSDTPSRIKANADVFDFELSKEQMASLDSLDQGKAGACSWNPVNAP